MNILRAGTRAGKEVQVQVQTHAHAQKQEFSFSASGSAVIVRPVRKAIYPGSFDPATYGHLDVLKRATHLFDEVVIAVAASESKKPLFSVDERVHLIEESIDHLNQVRVIRFDGLLVNLVREVSAVAVIRGLRAVSDFEFEFQMALMNRKLEPSLETIFLTPKEDYTYLSSRIVKEIARLGGDVTSFVPPAVEKALRVKFASASNAKNPFPV